MKNSPIKYKNKELDKMFYIPIPALTIDKEYKSCPYDDNNIYLCTTIECEDCLRNKKNNSILIEYNTQKNKIN